MQRLWIIWFVLLAAACQPQNPVLVQRVGLLEFDQTIRAAVTDAEPEHQWRFGGEAGQQLLLAIDASMGGGRIALLAPDGIPLYQRTVSGVDPVTIREALNLPASGTYTVSITRQEASDFTYSLGMRRMAIAATGQVPPTAALSTDTPTETAALAAPSTVMIPTAGPPRIGSGARLQPFQPVLGELRDAYTAERYTVSGAAGTVITIGAAVIPGSSVDPLITLYAPSGEILAEVDNTYGTQDAIISGLVLPATGAYVVYVRDSKGTGIGGYQLSYGTGYAMQDTMQPAPLPDTIQQGVLSQPATRDLWPLQLSVGDIISAVAAVDDTSGLDPALQLLTPGGQIIYADDNSGGGRSAALRQIIAPASGQFFLAVSAAREASYGPYSLMWRYDARAEE